MPTEALISVEEYLATSYRPDCDYVDGHIEERNLGEWDQADLQTAVAAYFRMRSKKWGIRTVVEQRVQVSPTRFRIPDVTIILGDPDGKILRKPPFICIEILSPEDRLKRVQTRIQDYLAMGVRYVWLLDPETRQVYVATGVEPFHEFTGEVLTTANPALEIPLREIFE